MGDTPTGVSQSFQAFLQQASGHAGAWMGAVKGLDEASALDKKTEELAYLAVLAAMRMESGVPFHVSSAKAAGATREEVISAIWSDSPPSGRASSSLCPPRCQPTTRSSCG